MLHLLSTNMELSKLQQLEEENHILEEENIKLKKELQFYIDKENKKKENNIHSTKKYVENNKEFVNQRARERYAKNKENKEWLENLKLKKKELYQKKKNEKMKIVSSNVEEKNLG